MSEIVIVNASSGRAACFAVKEGAGWISAYETSMIASLFSAVSFLVTLKEMTPAVLVSMSVIQLSLHLADRVAFATGFSIVYSIWKGPPSAGTSRLSLANTISGCAFGNHACFYCDTTVLASNGAGIDNLEHAGSQLPYVLIGAGVSIIGFLILGFVM